MEWGWGEKVEFLMSHASEIVLPTALDIKEVHDISVPLEVAPAYPGDDSYSRQWVSELEEGDDYNLSALTLGSHIASHLDFPSHVLKNGRTLEMYPLNRFIIPAQVIAFECDGAIQPSAIPLHSIDKRRGTALQDSKFIAAAQCITPSSRKIISVYLQMRPGVVSPWA